MAGQRRREPPRILHMYPSDDEEEFYGGDDLSKTLPSSFKFRNRRSTSNMHHSPSQTPTSGLTACHMMGDIPRPAHGLKRGKPVDSSQRPNFTKYRQMGSEPALVDFVQSEGGAVFSPEESFEEPPDEELLSNSLRNLKLPTRTQSLNQSPRSPRISSPSPCGSPRMWSPSVSNLERFHHSRRSEMRRWSLVSQSSGYTTGATDSPASLSSFPSQEQIPHDHSAVHSGGLPTKPTAETFADLQTHVSRHLRSNSSGSSIVTDEQDQNVQFRSRARSLSPERSPRDSLLDLDDTQAILGNRLPKAKDAMETQLLGLLEEFSVENKQYSDSNVNFGRHQILDFVRDLVDKSQQNYLSKDMFILFSENIRGAVSSVTERNGSESPDLNHLVQRIKTVISRVARLLEILEFDPNALCSSMLNLSGDDHSDWVHKVSSSHTPFILSRLNTSESNEEVKHVQQKERPSSLHLAYENVGHQSQPRKEDFSIIKIISNGAYGSVYLVRHKHTRKRFAMKKVNKKRMIMKKQAQQVFTERDILTFAENPFVVGLWCTFQTKNHLYMVMEYVEGGDVGTLLKNIGCLPLEMSRMYFAETVLALEYIHIYGIVHRDLKPDNLLITSEGHIKLTDFGLSKIGLTNYAAYVIEDAWSNKDEQFIDQEVYGTPDYIAPEVIMGQPYGQPVDWWSMGVILYEMLMGATPFQGCTVQELFDEITNEQLVIEFGDEEDDDVPDEAKHLILSLLRYHPLDRIGAASMGGVPAVKEHPFFQDLVWRDLLRQKAEFIPQLQGEEDTSYFDPRTDRHSHEYISDEEDGGGGEEETNKVFSNFTSTAPRMSLYLDENSFKLPTTDPLEGGPHDKEPTRDSGILDQYPETTSILGGSKEVSLLKDVATSGESGGMDEDEGDTFITNDDTIPSSEDDTRSNKTPILMESSLGGRATPLSPFRHKLSMRPASAGNIAGRPYPAQITFSPPTPVHGDKSLVDLRRNSMAVTPIFIEPNKKGFGLTLKPVRVYIGDSNNYKIHHIIQSVEKDGPAWKAGVRSSMLVTHINGEAVTGMHHVQVVSLMLKQKISKRKKSGKQPITMHTIPLDQTSIRQDGRKRVPWLGRRIGKFLRKQSSRVRRKPSMFRRFNKGASRTVEGTTSHSFSSSSGTPSPKLPSSPRRAESMKDPVRRSSTAPKWKPPVSPLARSTSPIPLSSFATPSTSQHGSNENLSLTTPPSSPSKHDRHSCHEPSLLSHKKSISTSELFLTSTKKSSPQTSPLLKRAVSPSPEQPFRVSKPRRSSTLERSMNIRSKMKRTPERGEEEEGDNPLSFI